MKKLFVSLMAIGLATFAQDMKDNPVAAVAANQYKQVSTNITKSIDKMPADKFGFKSSEGTMPFSEFIGHLTDANQNFCSAITGATKPASIRKETSKEVLAKAWAAAVAECTKAWSMSTDKSLGSMVKMGQREVPAAQLMLLNNSHSWEHYGNLVTLLRMNVIVPPSSEGR
ncbi:MAG: DinB family protein [Acidobacteria bacterium]|nr:DinB family protein [Acidobacteriota bacterium]